MRAWKQMLVLFATATCCALAPIAARATPISYNFTVTATTGPLAGTSSSGTFTYDSSVVPAILPADVNQTGLLTDLAFVWDGISYDETTANTGSLGFDAAGVLSFAFFGTDCGTGTCTVPPGTEAWSASTLGSPLGFFFYAIAGGPEETFQGRVSVSGPVRVPEPGTLTLLALGLAGLGFLRRRHAHPSAGRGLSSS
jgi:hypothetical protein